jgi:ATP-dependent Clp protease ATP-binding subunit ClpA
MEKVVDKFILELKEQLATKKIELELSDPARAWLAQKGYDPDNGARPLARLIQVEIKDKLSDEILFGNLTKRGKAFIDIENDQLMFSYT